MTSDRDTERDLAVPPVDATTGTSAPDHEGPSPMSTGPCGGAELRASGRFDTELRRLAQAGAAMHDAEALAQQMASNPALREQLAALAKDNPEGSGPFRHRIGPDLLPDAPPSGRAESVVIDTSAAHVPSRPFSPGRDDPTVRLARRPTTGDRVQALLLAMLVVAALATVAIVWASTTSPPNLPPAMTPAAASGEPTLPPAPAALATTMPAPNPPATASDHPAPPGPPPSAKTAKRPGGKASSAPRPSVPDPPSSARPPPPSSAPPATSSPGGSRIWFP